MTLRARIAIFCTVAVVASVTGCVVFLRAAAQEQRARSVQADPSERLDHPAVTNGGAYIVFRHAADDADWGKVALVPLDAPGGPRAVVPERCDRVAAARATGRITCLDAGNGVFSDLRVRIIDGETMEEAGSTGVAGLVPSRTRISDSGNEAATTSFVTGDSYQQPGQFSTRTRVYDLGTGGTVDGASSVDLEEFDVVVDGSPAPHESRNFWGVTFQSDASFFVTMGVGDGTWLMHGDLDQRQLESVVADVECPSLSPDGTHIAYKRRIDDGRWRLEVLDLATMERTELGEADSVDDQLAWLDHDTVMYGKQRPGQSNGRPLVWDVYAADLDGSPARLLISGAESPTVVDAP